MKKRLFRSLVLVALMIVINVNGAWAAKTATITVIFDMQGHGTQVDQQFISSGNKVKTPPTPMDNDYEFKAWYTEPTYLNKFNFDQPVTATKDSTITLYARWRNDAEYEQFQADLDKYSYVEYDSCYGKLGFKLHLATSADEPTAWPSYLSNELSESLRQFFDIEVSESVTKQMEINQYVTSAFMSKYPMILDELNKCFSELFGKEVTSLAELISYYEALPYRIYGKHAVFTAVSIPWDITFNVWAETNYGKDAEVCKCLMNSDVIFKANASFIEAWQRCDKDSQ